MKSGSVRLAMLLAVLSFFSACGGGGGGGVAAFGSPPVTLVSIEVTPADPFVAKNIDRQLTATGVYSNGTTTDMTASVTWSSSDASKIAVNSGSGLASFVKVGGPVTITATDSATQVSGSVTIPARDVVFVTSVTGTGNLGVWTDAGGQTGLAAGDAICQARATAAGLSGTFKAWLSDSADDAYCRVTGNSGTKAGNCGQATLPTGAGPWIRTDGYPFAATIDVVTSTNAQIYTPVAYDEFGQLLSSRLYFTDTNIDGTRYTTGGVGTCGDWQSEAGSTQEGVTTGVAARWTNYSAMSCSAASSLLCMQAGAGTALPQFASAGKKVFVTSATYNGNLGGLAGADAKCQTAASSAGLANAANFKAWLSDSTTDAVSRLTSDGPWVRLDGVPVAGSKADLTDDSINTSLAVTENTTYFANNLGAWTGTLKSGLKDTNTCNNWSDATVGFSGTSGAVSSSNDGWTQMSATVCNASFHLYCFED